MMGMSSREKKTRRRGDRWTERRRDGETERRGDVFSLSPRLSVSPSLCLSVSRSFIRSIHKSVFDQGPDGRKTVAPRDFLAFRKIVAVIRDRHLVELVFALENFGGDLRLEIEAVRPDLEVFDHVGAEDFVTGLHVREDRVVKHVGEQREHLVADEMPEVESARHLAPRK